MTVGRDGRVDRRGGPLLVRLGKKALQQTDIALERVIDDVLAKKPEPRHTGPVDPYDIRERLDTLVEGRHRTRADIWRQVMESHGFVFFTAARMNAVFGPLKLVPGSLAGLCDAKGRPIENDNLWWTRPHTEDQWRRDSPTRLAFTVADLFSLFEIPEKFDTWIRDHELRMRLSKRGIYIPRNRLSEMGIYIPRNR